MTHRCAAPRPNLPQLPRVAWRDRRHPGASKLWRDSKRFWRTLREAPAVLSEGSAVSTAFWTQPEPRDQGGQPGQVIGGRTQTSRSRKVRQSLKMAVTSAGVLAPSRRIRGVPCRECTQLGESWVDGHHFALVVSMKSVG